LVLLFDFLLDEFDFAGFDLMFFEEWAVWDFARVPVAACPATGVNANNKTSAKARHLPGTEA
jgi:hypothetical protein